MKTTIGIRKHSLLLFLFLLLLLGTANIFPLVAHGETGATAQSGETPTDPELVDPTIQKAATDKKQLGLHIVKYALTDEQLQDFQKQTGDQLDPAADQELKPVAGAQYTVQKVTPTTTQMPPKYGDQGSYTIDASFKLVELTTNAQGEADLTSATDPALVEGYYLITEVANKVVLKPMTPVIVKLPLSVDGKPDNWNVYLYPKSGAVSNNGEVPPPTPPDTGRHTPPPPKIPETGGEMLHRGSALWLIMLPLFLGVFTWIIQKRAKESME